MKKRCVCDVLCCSTGIPTNLLPVDPCEQQQAAVSSQIPFADICLGKFTSPAKLVVPLAPASGNIGLNSSTVLHNIICLCICLLYRVVYILTPTGSSVLINVCVCAYLDRRMELRGKLQ
jgi:hypothetical protein